MVAQPQETTSRRDALLEAGIEIASLNKDVETLTKALNANRLRADHAEKLNRQLEAQLTHSAKETVTLVQPLHLPADRTKADHELVERINAGWEIASEIVNTLDVVQHFRIVRFIRTAPIEPAPDQPPVTATVTEPVQNLHPLPLDPTPDSPRLEGERQGVRVLTEGNPAHPSISGLWNALYTMDRYLELVEHWPMLPQYAPRVYAVFEAAGCDMNDVVILKSFRSGRRDDQWTLKIIFRHSTQVVPGTQTALVAAAFRNVIAREGREFIFDLPEAWVSPRKTITAASMTIIENTALTPDADYQIPPYQTPPVGMDRDQRVEYRMDQIRTADRQFINAIMGGQS